MPKSSALKKATPSPESFSPPSPSDALKPLMQAPNSLGITVDELGVVQAQIAKLTEREVELKAIVAQAGAGGHDGNLFHANVSISERTSTDAAFKAKVKELILAHTTTKWRAAHSSSKPSTTVKVTARSAALVAAGKAVRS